MSIQLERNLPHQINALKAIDAVFEDVHIQQDNLVHQNPIIDLQDPQLIRNIRNIWGGRVEDLPAIPNAMRRQVNDGILGIDIKMETGTGKTYVYTRMMYELNQLGFNKFILLVPSTPIREGTKKFIEADYSKRQFADLYPDRQIELSVLTAQKRSKGRKMFPAAISDFARGTRLDQTRIHALLMTDSMLLSKATMAKDDYDQTLLGTFTQPYEALRETRPIVIIDEPHRFKRENKAYQTIVDELQPQMVIRFGATFPYIDNSDEIDYNHLIYNLGASQSFNANLVKGVAAQTLENVNEEGERLKLMKYTVRPQQVYFRDEKTKKSHLLELGDDLGEIHTGFSGVTVESLSRSETATSSKGVTLSNGLVLNETDIVYESSFSNTYQELMVRQAIRNHLRIEHNNFMRTNKIKTLSLFFIDSIFSYRGSDDSKGPLRVKFEQILTEETIKLMKEYEDESDLNFRQEEYLDFLKTSIKEIEYSSGGYFAEDNSTKDEDIQKEVDQILRDKDSLLTFKDDKGRWNTRRFIFSKWTLREGWDNPNVFQIAKLRSSGSDISKLQEVGRGLRLPVDEFGQRISDEQFYLTYLIDFSEVDFAERLVDEINSEVEQLGDIQELLPIVAEERGMEEKALAIELFQKDYVTANYEIIDENKEIFFAEYPEFNQGLKPGKVINSTKDKKTTVKVMSENYRKIKSLWKELNQKYYLKLEETDDEALLKAITDILSDKQDPVYVRENVHVTEERTKSKNGTMIIEEEIVDTYRLNEKIPYNEFLIRLNKVTGLPVQLTHKGLVAYFKDKKVPADFFNRSTLSKFIQKFKSWFIKEYDGHYTYERLNISRDETALTDYQGNLKKEIVQGTLGLYRADHITTPDNFLYDTVVYDSPKELSTITESGSNRLTNKVIVFGKIPRKSIQVPLYFGGTVSPDFMYVLEDNKEEYRVGFIVETKDMKNRESLRGDEENRISSAQTFFETMKADGMNVEFKAQLQNDDIIEMIEQLFV